MNEFQLISLELMACYGLKKKHFKDCGWFNTYLHVLSLSRLVNNQNMSILDALASIKKLNQNQLSFLQKHCTQGLTGKFLINNLWFNSSLHEKAAEYLIAHYKLTPQAAISELKGLTTNQIGNLMSGLYRREDVVGLTDLQFKATHSVLNRWFKVEDFRDQDWFNEDKHIEMLHAIALKYQNKIPCKSMMRALKRVNHISDWHISKDWVVFEKINADLFNSSLSNFFSGLFSPAEKPVNIQPENNNYFYNLIKLSRGYWV